MKKYRKNTNHTRSKRKHTNNNHHTKMERKGRGVYLEVDLGELYGHPTPRGSNPKAQELYNKVKGRLRNGEGGGEGAARVREERPLKQGAKATFYKSGSAEGTRAPWGRLCAPKILGKLDFFQFSIGPPWARAVGPTVVRSGRKGVELHTDTPKRVRTTRTN